MIQFSRLKLFPWLVAHVAVAIINPALLQQPAFQLNTLLPSHPRAEMNQTGISIKQLMESNRKRWMVCLSPSYFPSFWQFHIGQSVSRLTSIWTWTKHSEICQSVTRHHLAQAFTRVPWSTKRSLRACAPCHSTFWFLQLHLIQHLKRLLLLEVELSCSRLSQSKLSRRKERFSDYESSVKKHLLLLFSDEFDTERTSIWHSKQSQQTDRRDVVRSVTQTLRPKELRTLSFSKWSTGSII